MHPRIQELINHLDTHRETLRAAVDSVPAHLRDKRVETDKWSVAEILEHLAIVENIADNKLGKLLDNGIENGLGRETETSSVIAMVDMNFLLDRSRKINSPEAGRPTGKVNAADAWKELEKTNKNMLELLRKADGYALAELSMPHPAAGPLNMYQWIGFRGGHEARHAAQIKEIGEILNRAN